MAKYGDQPAPTSLSERGHRQIPKAPTSIEDNLVNHTLVGGVQMSGNCKIITTRGGGWDDAFVPFDERRLRSICQHRSRIQTL